MLKLWGRETSGRTQKVLWTLAETGIEFELIRASGEMGPGGHVSKGNKPYGLVDTAEYRAKNPNGRVPTIDDDGFVLSESMAINLYLAKKHKSALYPADAKNEALAWQWSLWETDRLDRQIVLVDALAALNQGAHAVDDLSRALQAALAAQHAAVDTSGAPLSAIDSAAAASH